MDVTTYQILLLMSGKEFLNGFKEEQEVRSIIMLKPKEEEVRKKFPKKRGANIVGLV